MEDGLALLCEGCVEKRKKRNLLIMFSECKPKLYKKAGIPNEFWNAGITDCRKMERFVGQSLLLIGQRGVGKTHAAVALVARHMETTGDFSAKFVTAADLLLDVRASYNGEQNEQQIINKYTLGANTLILDDLGAEKSTEWAIATLGIIIDRRYREKQLTIVTTNLTVDELTKNIGDRITSRLVGLCEVVIMNGKDRRIRED